MHVYMIPHADIPDGHPDGAAALNNLFAVRKINQGDLMLEWNLNAIKVLFADLIG